MSYLKISSDLFLGSQELNRLVKFLDEDGFRKLLLQNSLSFGIINISKDGEFDNFRIEQGTNIGTIKNSPGLALDVNGQLITRVATDNIDLTNDNQWYWVKIKHQYSPNEQGLVSIDRSGNLTGSGTEFLKVLRGAPNNQVKVRFEGSSLNTSEYFVQEVIDDNSAILSGDFLAESNLQLVVVGAFTPDTVTPSGSKEIYQYSDCLLSLVLETVSNTPPTLIDGQEFVIARVKRNGSTITIQDKRSLAIYRTKPDFDLHTIVSDPVNPLIGVEAVKFNNILSPRDKNLVYLAWAFRSGNWTIDSSTNRVTLIGGNGGKFKSTADFTDGDFDGWTIYTANGKKSIIRQSSISALQINLILDTLDPDDYIDTTQQLVVSPSVEFVEIVATPQTGQSQLTAQRFTFPVNQGYAIIPLSVYKDSSCIYEIKYRYQTYKLYSEETLIPNDAVGYFVEADFDNNGDSIAIAKQTYTDGLITLQQATNAYSNRIAGVETGDLFGVEYLAINTDTVPVMDFVVGTRKRYVVITNDDDLDASDSDFGTPYQLTANAFINLKTDLPTTLKNGNSFLIQVRGDYDFNGFTLKIVEDYVNGSNPGELLYQINASDLEAAAIDDLFFICEFDGTRWFVRKVGARGIVIPGNGLDDNFNVNVDGASIEIDSDTLRLPDGHLAVQSPDAVKLYTKVVQIGDWNMDADTTTIVPHGLGADFIKIRNVTAMIQDDASSFIHNLAAQVDYISTPVNTQGGIRSIDSTNITLYRLSSASTGFFDQVNFNATGFNRGWVTIVYEA